MAGHAAGDPTADLPAQLNVDRLPAYLSLDAHLARVFITGRGRLEVYADVKNATNRRNLAGHLYDPQLFRDEARLLPIVPSIGVRWSW